MSWNLRLVDHTDDDGIDFVEICEVYYDELGIPMGYCAASMSGDNKEDVKTYLLWALEALDKPVLSFEFNQREH